MSPRGLALGYLRSRTLQLALALVAIFVGEVLIKMRFGAGANALLFQVTAVPLAKPWTILTNPLGHKSLGHVLGNAAGLALVGYPVERALGARRMLLLFTVGGGLAGWIQAVVAGGDAVGASGAVLLLLALDLALVLRWEVHQGWLPLGRVPGSWGGVCGVLALVGVVFLGPPALAQLGTGIGGICHLVGFLLGVAAAWRWTRPVRGSDPPRAVAASAPAEG